MWNKIKDFCYNHICKIILMTIWLILLSLYIFGLTIPMIIYAGAISYMFGRAADEMRY